MLLEEQEDLEQGERMAAEHAVVHDLDLPVADLEPPIEGPYARAALAVEEALAEELQQQFVQPAEGVDGPVVALHELLDAEIVVGVAVPEMVRDRDLPIEEQPVLAPAGEVVKRGSRLPQEVLAVAQASELLLGQETVVEEIAKPGARSALDAEVAPRDPGDGLDVAEPARPLLHVRLEVVGRVAVAEVPLALLALLGVKEPVGGPHPGRRHRIAHLVEQLARPGQVPGFDEVGDHGEVAAGLRRALPDAAHRVPDLEPEVPGQGDERFDAGVRTPALERGRPPGVDQHQQVDVGARVQLSSPVSSDRDEGRVAALAEALPGSPQRLVHGRRPLRDELGGRGSPLEPRPDLGAPAIEGGSELGVAGRGQVAGLPPSRVRISQPSGVTRMVCSH